MSGLDDNLVFGKRKSPWKANQASKIVSVWVMDESPLLQNETKIIVLIMR